MTEIFARAGLALGVCSDLAPDAMLAWVNDHEPCGTSGGWGISPEPFDCGEPNPSPCESRAGCTHYKLEAMVATETGPIPVADLVGLAVAQASGAVQ